MGGFVYRLAMRLAHKYNWHYMPPCYPERDVMLWCHWCGIRVVVHKDEPPTTDSVPKAANTGNFVYRK